MNRKEVEMYVEKNQDKPIYVEYKSCYCDKGQTIAGQYQCFLKDPKDTDNTVICWANGYPSYIKLKNIVKISTDKKLKDKIPKPLYMG